MLKDKYCVVVELDPATYVQSAEGAEIVSHWREPAYTVETSRRRGYGPPDYQVLFRHPTFEACERFARVLNSTFYLKTLGHWYNGIETMFVDKASIHDPNDPPILRCVDGTQYFYDLKDAVFKLDAHPNITIECSVELDALDPKKEPELKPLNSLTVDITVHNADVAALVQELGNEAESEIGVYIIDHIQEIKRSIMAHRAEAELKKKLDSTAIELGRILSNANAWIVPANGDKVDGTYVVEASSSSGSFVRSNPIHL